MNFSVLSFGETSQSEKDVKRVANRLDLFRYFNFVYDADKEIITITSNKSLYKNAEIEVSDVIDGYSIVDNRVQKFEDNSLTFDTLNNDTTQLFTMNESLSNKVNEINKEFFDTKSQQYDKNRTIQSGEIKTLTELDKFFFVDIAGDKVIIQNEKEEIDKLTKLTIPAKIFDDDGKVYLVGFDTLAISMFSECKRLEEVVFEDGIITGYLTSIAGMFRNCSNLKKVDMSGINLDSLECTANMFEGCTNLEEVLFPEKAYSLNRLVDVALMFQSCSKLHTLSLKGIGSQVINTRDMFLDCVDLHNIITQNNSVLIAFNEFKSNRMKQQYG